MIERYHDIMIERISHVEFLTLLKAILVNIESPKPELVTRKSAILDQSLIVNTRVAVHRARSYVLFLVFAYHLGLSKPLLIASRPR